MFRSRVYAALKIDFGSIKITNFKGTKKVTFNRKRVSTWEVHKVLLSNESIGSFKNQ
jgi:hypothetical protein